jgi:nucleotide-binding universal stress UspA family protein
MQITQSGKEGKGGADVLNHILLILNNGKWADQLIAHSASIARAANAKVTLLRALDTSNKRVDPLDWHIRKVEAETNLNQLAEQLQREGVETQVTITEVSDAAQLFEYAQANQVDLILVPRAAETTNGLIHGLMKRTDIPILVIPQGGFLLNDARETACYTKVLIPLDGSQRAECTLPWASFLTQTCQSKLILAHVIRKPEMPRRAPLTSEENELAERIVESNRSEASRYLEQVASWLPGQVETRLLINDNVPTTLHRLAEDEGIDLIVVSAHGYSGEPQWPYGGIANSLISYSARPILVVQDLPVAGRQPSLEEQPVAHRGQVR